MQVELQAHIAFHLTGRSPGASSMRSRELDLRPALFAGYRDLTALRYDFPLVLIADGDEQRCNRFPALFDARLKDIAGRRRRRTAAQACLAPRAGNPHADRGRRHRTLSVLWDTAAGRLGAKNDELFQDSLKRLRAALKIDGEVIDCDQAMPFRLFQHVWKGCRSRRRRSSAPRSAS